jgi:hypothetical protein
MPVKSHYVDRVTGQLQRGQIAPADRRYLAVWLRRFHGVPDVEFRGGGLQGGRERDARWHAPGGASTAASPLRIFIGTTARRLQRDQRDGT